MSEELPDKETKKRIDAVLHLIEASLSLEKEDHIKTAALIVYISELVLCQDQPKKTLYALLKAIYMTVAVRLSVEKKDEMEDFPFWQSI